MVAVRAPPQEVYTDMQKKAQQSNVTTFFTKVLSLPFSCIVYHYSILTIFSQEG